MEEKQLIKQCQEGDRKAFELLVHQYSPILMAICYRYMKDESSAKDALQECFITVIKSINGFKSKGSFEGWMKRIAVTSSLKELRKRKPNVHNLAMVDNDQDIGIEQPIALDQLNVEDTLKKINELPEEYRIVFNMYIIEGFSYREISDLLGIQESSCRMRLSRARKKLHTILNKEQEYYGFERTRKVD